MHSIRVFHRVLVSNVSAQHKTVSFWNEFFMVSWFCSFGFELIVSNVCTVPSNISSPKIIHFLSQTTLPNQKAQGSMNKSHHSVYFLLSSSTSVHNYYIRTVCVVTRNKMCVQRPDGTSCFDAHWFIHYSQKRFCALVVLDGGFIYF